MKFLMPLLFIAFFFACKKDKSVQESSKQTNYKKELVPSKKITLKNNGYFYSFYTQTDSSNDSIIYRKKMRSGKDGIDIYNVYKKESQQEIIFTPEVLRLLGRYHGFNVKSKDSIFLFGLNKIMMINSEGDVFFERKLLSDDQFSENKPISSAAVMNKSQPYLFQNKIYLTYWVDLPPDKSNALYKSNVTSIYNLNGHFSEMSHSNYPKAYFDRCWSSLDTEVSNVLRKNTAIFSFPIEDTLYTHDLSGKKGVKKKIARSKYKKREIEPIPCDKLWEQRTYFKHSYESFLYLDLVYDRFRDVYYRFCKHPKEDYSMKDKFNSLNDTFSIMVLDSQLNVIYETEVLNIKPKYINFDYFVNKEGLWISTSNPDNENYREDELGFELFKLKNNED
ncbi:DUF4221 family protein [Tenacibaculum maritimum]|uniref:DUF4221 family protein n=1 Tax=Tenacibaculum maritimum TaxID=107401 RepID=UPI001E312926|nr:DUF4221 family protein [Tenacibaculum maritimum]MCD9609499.1 DUF4221 domain-containing protein [Tenacibaculum maritimum]